MNRVAGKVAIVTGAASAAGIGFATARALARQGAKVMLTDIDEKRVLARAQELADAGHHVIARQLDVGVEEEWQSTVAQTVGRFGSLDILVNNAGIIGRFLVHEMPLDTWESVIRVNLTGTFLGCKHAVARMRQQGTGGSLINVSSTSGLVGVSRSSAYGSSKGGVRQLSKVVAIEGAQYNIRCNSVYPGFIETEILKRTGQASPLPIASIPMERPGEPDDIANAILFLASDESKYVTGAEIVVDGGATSH